MIGINTSEDAQHAKRRVLAVCLAVIVAMSMLLPFAAASVAAAPQGNGGPPASPTGHAGVPSGSVQVSSFPGNGNGPPQHAAAWGVTASEHAGTMLVEITTDADGDLVLKATDDQYHAGRQLSVNASALEAAVGYRPDLATVTHESGDRYEVPVSYSGGRALFDVQEFSTNEITFAGERRIEASPAVDGDSFTYEMADSESAENFSVELTGSTATRWNNVSGSSLRDGDTLQLAVGGNVDPKGPSTNGEPVVEFTGKKQTIDQSDSWSSINGDTTKSVTVNGTSEPTNEQITVSGRGQKSGSADVSGYTSGSTDTDTIESSAPSGTIVWAKASTYENSDSQDDEITAELKAGGGTVVSSSQGRNTGSSSNTVYPDYSVSSGDTIELVCTADNNQEGYSNGCNAYYGLQRNGTVTIEAVSTGDTVSFTNVSYDGSQTKSINLSTGTQSISLTGNPLYGSMTADYTEVSETDTPSIDIDGDGTDEALHSGTLSQGETVTYEIPSLSTSDDTATVSTVSYQADTTIRLKERTQTVDPTIEINEQTVSHSGSLADGETVTLSPEATWITNGTNQVNVSTASPAGGPVGQVAMTYSHTATDKRSVEYHGEAFSERYNASRTWTEDTADAELRIPWASDRVISIRDILVSRNGSTVSDPTYRYENGTLVVELGNVLAGETTTVSATGSKVQVESGSIDVIEPTTEGDTLNSKIQITEKNQDFALRVGGTYEGHLIHYLTNESWSVQGEYAIVESNGQRVYAPGASAGSTARVRTAPIEVDPQSDARITMTDVDRPEFKIEPGPTTGDSLTVRYYDTTSGSKYGLYSKTRGGYKVTTDTAESPAIFDIQDDGSEVYYIELIEPTSGSGGSGGGGGAPVPTDTGSPLSNPLLLIPIAGVVVFGGAVGVSRTGVGRWAIIAVTAIVGILSVVALVPNAISQATLFVAEQFGAGLGQVSPVLWLAGGAVVLYGVYRFVKSVTTRDSVVIEAVRRR